MRTFNTELVIMQGGSPLIIEQRLLKNKFAIRFILISCYMLPLPILINFTGLIAINTDLVADRSWQQKRYI